MRFYDVQNEYGEKAQSHLDSRGTRAPKSRKEGRSEDSVSTIPSGNLPICRICALSLLVLNLCYGLNDDTNSPYLVACFRQNTGCVVTLALLTILYGSIDKNDNIHQWIINVTFFVVWDIHQIYVRIVSTQLVCPILQDKTMEFHLCNQLYQLQYENTDP